MNHDTDEHSASPTPERNKDFRLPRGARPERYRFRVVPDLGALRFDARGAIELVLDRPARELTLHGAHLDVRRAVAHTASAAAPLRVAAEPESQTLSLTPSDGSGLPAGALTLELEWSGGFQPDLRGLYLAGGVAVTQFEAADARRVFPCFDEPAFKAVWELEVEAAPGLAVIGNGAVLSDGADEQGRRVVRLAPTPKMSSYLVALVVGELEASEACTARGVPVRTWAVPTKAHLREFAQECATAVLPLLEDYFGLPYAFGKLDQLGIPDFEAGAMENADCITFREVALLVDPARASLGIKKRVAEVITHELAHQWFGNLVTMAWWDDLWLNEAFATWMAYKIVDQWRPAWRMWDDFEGGKAAALHLDSMESTHPIHAEVRNAEQATENFDVITYEKGGAMLRMLEGYLGADAFRDGIRRYMKRHAYANAVADDLWGALGEASGQPIAEVANGWIGRGGFPLVDLDFDEDGAVRLAQRRFHAEPTKMGAGDDEAPWLVPLVLRWADDAGVHTTRHLLRAADDTLRLDANGPVRFVNGNQDGAGFYRVRYPKDAALALARHADALSPVERVNLVADAWALFRAGAGPLAAVLDLLVAFADDRDYTVLGQVVGRLELLEREDAGETERATLRRLVRERFLPRLAELGYDSVPDKSGEPEPDATRLERAQVLRALALVARVPEVTAELRARLERFWSGEVTPASGALDPNLLDAASLAVARAADDALYERLRALAVSDPDPAGKRRHLVSLASVENPALVERAVAEFHTDTVPMQDASTYLGALLGNHATAARAWAEIRDRWTEVHKKTAAPMLTRRVVEALGLLHERRAEVEAFFDAQRQSLAAAPAAVRQTRERLRLDEDVHRRARLELGAWLATK